MKKACFITGTDTGVGKTTIAASLARGFQRIGIRVGVMKPVETGCRQEGGALIGSDAALLREAAAFDAPMELINPYAFAPPLSPALAAEQAGREIDLAVIRDAYVEIRKMSDVIIVEGAGGLLSPLGRGSTMAELPGFLSLPVLIVAPSRIGVVNQCMLTVHAARERGLAVRGIVLNRPEPPAPSDRSLESNMEEVGLHTGEEVLADIPFAEKNAPYVDVKGVIKNLISRDFNPSAYSSPELFQ